MTVGPIRPPQLQAAVDAQLGGAWPAVERELDQPVHRHPVRTTTVVGAGGAPQSLLGQSPVHGGG